MGGILPRNTIVRNRSGEPPRAARVRTGGRNGRANIACVMRGAPSQCPVARAHRPCPVVLSRCGRARCPHRAARVMRVPRGRV